MSQDNELKWLYDFLPYIEEIFQNKKEDVGFDHSVRTMNIARYIAALEHADKDMAALLGLLARFTPAEIGNVLPLLDKSEEFKKQFVKNFEDLIVNNNLNTPEVQIANDATCLEAMGAIGIIRHFYRGASEKLPLKLLIKNFADKVAKLQASIGTATGKNMAVERQSFIATFLNRLKGETVWENI
ncbi:MAG: putative hydrolase [bacterium ADurb.Bin243]|nr:MAG: putative hydrolase [bacterium ADurb.Bin243]HOD40218.1 hypothetical protein [Candidatus Wallbacteria bacterium]